MKNPTLVILAAGMGRRYGGLKQLEPVGPDGAALMEYGIYDAIQAGFDRVVFVVRPEIEQALREHAGPRYAQKVDVAYVQQRIDVALPDGVAAAGRTKPWGTGQAVLSAADVVDAPFAVMNADDFYGPRAFQMLGSFLSDQPDRESTDYALIGYPLKSTLSEGGAVARGVCRCDEAGWLIGIVETTGIEKRGGDGLTVDEDGTERVLPGDTTVSMNTWGFSPSVFRFLSERFEQFLDSCHRPEEDEFYLPAAIEDLVRSQIARVRVMPTTDTWCGVTYPGDRELVVQHLSQLVADGRYPRNLW